MLLLPFPFMPAAAAAASSYLSIQVLLSFPLSDASAAAAPTAMCIWMHVVVSTVCRVGTSAPIDCSRESPTGVALVKVVLGH